LGNRKPQSRYVILLQEQQQQQEQQEQQQQQTYIKQLAHFYTLLRMMKVGVFCNISALPFSHCISAAGKTPFQFRKASKGEGFRVGRRPTVINGVVGRRPTVIDVVPPGPTDDGKLEDQVNRLTDFYMSEEAQSGTKLKEFWKGIHQDKNPDDRNKANQDIQEKALQKFQKLLDLPIEQFIEPNELLAQGKALLQIYLGLAPKRPMKSMDSVDAFRVQIQSFSSVFTDENAQQEATRLFEDLVENVNVRKQRLALEKFNNLKIKQFVTEIEIEGKPIKHEYDESLFLRGQKICCKFILVSSRQTISRKIPCGKKK